MQIYIIYVIIKEVIFYYSPLLQLYPHFLWVNTQGGKIMSLANLIANGTVSLEELASAQDLIDRAKFVKAGIDACKENLVFPLGTTEINCYDFLDNAGEYHSHGIVKSDGSFTCWSNWGGDHINGTCNLFDFNQVFNALDSHDFKYDLRKFLSEQIEKARKK